MEDLEMTEDHLEQSHQNMDKIHRRRQPRLVRNEQWQSLDWKRWQRSVLRERIASVKAERTRKFTSTSIGVARKIERKKMKIERRAENLDEEVAKEKDRAVVSGHEAARRGSLDNA
jgi:hypothetical protein